MGVREFTRDNQEYQMGREDFSAGKTPDDNPFKFSGDGDSPYARWASGYNDQKSSVKP